jgi:hypothetical protein
MWREACALLLIAATTRGQEQVPVPAADPASVASPPAIRVEVYQYYTALRRGTAENVAIVLLASYSEGVSTGSGIEITSLTLELPKADGLAISKLHYPRTRKKKFPFLDTPIAVTTAGLDSPIRFKLRADDTTAIGTHTLSGRLRYQIVDDRGESPCSRS